MTVPWEGNPFRIYSLKHALNIEGKDAVIFEDSISGIKAAEAAKASKIVIVNSNDNDYAEYEDRYPVIKDFNKVDFDWFK